MANPTHEIATWIGRKADPETENPEFQGFDSVRFLVSSDGIPRSIGNFPEIKTQRFTPVRLVSLRGGIPRSLVNFPQDVDSEILGLRILSLLTGRTLALPRSGFKTESHSLVGSCKI